MNQSKLSTKIQDSQATKRIVRKEDYLPLIVIVLVVSLSACADQWARGMWNSMLFMREFMALFWLILAMLKLFDLRGFAGLFQQYDLIGKRSRIYALVYPFIELLLGLAYQANVLPALTNSVSLVLMVIATIGVLLALHKKMDTSWCCLGAVLKVPLSPLAVLVDLGMAAMAGGMLLMGAA